MFSTRSGAADWQMPWLMMCVLAAIDLWCNNFFWLLEGTNQLTIIYFYRFGRGVVASVSLWIFLSHGYGLYALPLSLGAAVLFTIAVLLLSRLHFVLFFFKTHPIEGAISWRREILPLQLRLGVSQIAGFIQYSLFVPITFRMVGTGCRGANGAELDPGRFHGGRRAVMARGEISHHGRAGRVARLGGTEPADLACGAQALALVILGAVTLIALRIGVTAYHFRLDGRLLPLLAFALLSLSSISKVLASVMISYLRAHKKEPIVVLTAIVTPVMLCAALGGAALGGTLGIVIGYASVMTFFMLPGTAWISGAKPCRLASRPFAGMNPRPAHNRASASMPASAGVSLLCALRRTRE